MNDYHALERTRQLWDGAAVTFDDEPDHGLRDPTTYNAWRDLLVHWLAPEPQRILDIGCGTGSLSVLLAELGHNVTGIDLSPAMIARARAKVLAAGHQATFHVMDAARPQLAPQRFDVILCRHLLWTLPQPAQVLERWKAFLSPAGRLILVEGFWKTGAGLHVQEVVDALPVSFSNVTVQQLSGHVELWGGETNDERYAVVAHY